MNILLLNYNATYRLKSKGPACLLKVNKTKTLIENQIETLNKVFINPNIIVLSGFKHKKIKSILETKKVNIIENEDYESTNDLYNIGLSINSGTINKSLLIIPGNIKFTNSIFKNFDSEVSQLWITKEQQELGCIITDNKVQHVMWTLPNYWTNIGYFVNKEFELLEEIVYNQENINKLFLFEAINTIIDRGGAFEAINKANKIRYINKATDV